MKLRYTIHFDITFDVPKDYSDDLEYEIESEIDDLCRKIPGNLPDMNIKCIIEEPSYEYWGEE